MAEITFKRKDVVAKDVVNAVVFESPDKRITVVAKPKWMKDELLAENIRVFGKHGNITLPAEKMLAVLSNELIIHDGWNLAIRVSWAAGETVVDSVDQLRGYLKRAVEQARDKKATKPSARPS